MSTVSVREAQASLADLVEKIETGRESEIVIARDGHPAARLVPLAEAAGRRRLGMARGAFAVAHAHDQLNPLIERRLGGRDE